MVYYTGSWGYLLMVVSCPLFLTASVRCQCISPIKEGQEGQIVCSAPTIATRLLWQLQRSGEWVNVSTCELQGASNDLFPTSFKAQYLNTASEHKSVLTVVKANRSEATFKCVVIEGGTGEVQCQINVYDGPNSVSMDKTDKYFDLCPSDVNNLTITCTVPIDQVYPAPKFIILLDSRLVVNRQPGFLSGTEYNYTYAYRPQTGGFPTATCRAENSVFPIQASQTVTMQVREPPKAEPKMSVMYQGVDLKLNKVTLQGGETLTVTCQVEGGVPEVESVSLWCGSKRVDTSGKLGELNLVVTAGLNGQICSCSASHVTKCYTKTATVLLQVAIKPATAEPPNGPSVGLIAGLAAGLGGAIVIVVVLVVVICRRLKRQSPPSQPPQQPKHVAQWVNNISLYDDTDHVPGSDRYAPFLKAQPLATSVAGDSNIYDEIRSLPDYTMPPNNGIYAPRRHTNNLYEGDYIHPA